MKEAKFIYKCRNCGETFIKGCYGSDGALQMLVQANLSHAHNQVSMQTVHFCYARKLPPNIQPYTGCGVADLQGYKIE